MRRAILFLAGGLLLVVASAAQAQTLRGSRTAMQRQNRVARSEDYTFLSSSSAVRKFVDLGLLERVRSTSSVQLKGVSHPYARPALRVFVERLGQQYRESCGEKLVVTSLTRPVSEQPRNAHELSVHPTGMAVDLRISNRRSCQRWLEETLLALEDRGLLEATRERRPPHFHVAVFPDKYLAYVRGHGGSAAKLASAERKATSASLASSSSKQAPTASLASSSSKQATASGKGSAGQLVATVEKYKVNRGDTLWTIARRYGTTVDQIKELNNLRSSRIAAGQVITVPLGAAAP